MDTLLLAPRVAGRGGEGRVSALLPLLDDVRHRLRRGASHLPARRSRQSVHIISSQTLKPELQTPFSVALWLNRRAVINNDFFLQTGLEYIMGRSSTPIRVDPGGTQ